MADQNASTASAGPPTTVDPQDPLPESNWTWRRWFIIGICIFGIIGIAVALTMLFHLGNETLGLVRRIAVLRDAKALDNALNSIDGVVIAIYKLGMGCIYLLGFAMLLYLVAPSAEQIAKMFATLSAWKGGISTASFSKATGPDGSTAEAGKSAGPAVAQPTAPAAPAPASAPAPAPPKATDIIE